MIKGYKAFNKDLTCRGFQYEIGKTYIHNGKIELCESGFHFCIKCAYCFNYYSRDARICEIEALGDIDHDECKYVTNKIKIIRELSHGEILDACNSGNRNSGDWNSGNLNSGDWNSGNWNSGNLNSGDLNSGDWNSGNWNSGNRNSGDWNSGNRNSGYLNTNEPLIRIFDKETDKKRNQIVFPNFFFFDLNIWIDAENMTEKEQKEHPSWQVTRGYLKTYKYKDAWKQSFIKAKASNDWLEEKRKLLSLPNFDFAKFEEISGISKKDIME